MVIAAAKVRSLCTTSEIALVRASRKPEIERLSKVEIKRLAVRARKLFDKWQGLARRQSRSRRMATGSGDQAENTRIKAQIFRDALDALEAQLAKTSTPGPRKAKPLPPNSKQRSKEHRAIRAAVRKGLVAVEDLVNSQSPAQLPAAEQSTGGGQSIGAAAAVEPPAKKRSPGATKPAAGIPAEISGAKKKLSGPVKPPLKAGASGVSKQRAAVTAAKQSRVVRSGKTTRMLGHVSASGKRAQGRRDAKRSSGGAARGRSERQ